MVAVKDATFLLRQIPIINTVYAWRIPPEKEVAKSTVEALVTDVISLGIPGSDKTASIYDTVAVNIFIGKISNISIDEITKQVIQKFEHAGWVTKQIGSVTIDPDTDQLARTFQFIERTYINGSN